MLLRCQLSNTASEPGQIQDSLLVPWEQCGQSKHEQFLYQSEGLLAEQKDKDGQESFQEGICVEPKPVPGQQDTNTSHGHIQTTPDIYSTLELTHTHHAPHIQAKDLRTSKHHKEPRMNKRSEERRVGKEC